MLETKMKTSEAKLTSEATLNDLAFKGVLHVLYHVYPHLYHKKETHVKIRYIYKTKDCRLS